MKLKDILKEENRAGNEHRLDIKTIINARNFFRLK